MKIGIFLKNINNIESWEIKFVDALKKYYTNEVILITGNSLIDKKDSLLKNDKKLKSHIISMALVKFHLKIEKRIFKINATNNSKFDINSFELNVINFGDTIQNSFNHITDAEIICTEKFDLIINLSSNRLDVSKLSYPTYGIWTMNIGDNSLNDGTSSGFWEVIFNQPFIAVTLWKQSDVKDDDKIISQSFHNIDWSSLRNYNFIREQSISTIIKNINKLIKNQSLSSSLDHMVENSISAPNLIYVLGYLKRFYIIFFRKLFIEFGRKNLGLRYKCWTVFSSEGNIFDAKLSALEPSKLPKSVYWADPFLFSYKGIEYLFFESYSYINKKGKISCGKLNGNQISDIHDVFDFDYHLSYPFIFNEGDDIFIIPETSGNRRVEVYKCLDFPTKWELYATAFEGESIVDTTYYVDTKKQKWLFLNRAVYSNDLSSELYIYQIDSLKLTNIKNHKQNPVIIDSRVARNAGPIFEYKDKIIRPSQQNINGNYGHGLNLNEIKELSLENYREENIKQINPDFRKGLMATHHIHQHKDRFVLDGAFKRAKYI